MGFNADIDRATRISFAVPTASKQADLQRNLAEAFGGYTCHSGFGRWRDIGEPVLVYEVWVQGRAFSWILEATKGIGAQFLQDNPAEECFMAYVSGRLITITRKDQA